jgi:hypothetical protein
VPPDEQASSQRTLPDGCLQGHLLGIALLTTSPAENAMFGGPVRT